MISIIDYSFTLSKITILKAVHPDPFLGGAMKAQIFL